MATYITIIDTVKAGWLTINTNVLYTSTAVNIKQLNILKSSVNAINIVRDPLGNVYLEVHTSNTAPPFTISADTAQSRYYPIESVNGVAPVDADDLKDKISVLL